MSSDLPPNVVRIHDYHIKRERKSLERQAAKIMSLIDFAKTGAPIIEGSVPLKTSPELLAKLREAADPWAGRHSGDPA